MNYDELDPGIREKVRAIHDLGYHTTDSGDGVSKPADAEGVLPFPHIVVKLRYPALGIVEYLHDYVRAHFGPRWVAELSWVPDEPAIVMLRGPELGADGD